MKKLHFLIGLGLIFLTASVAKAGIRFDAVHQFQVFNDDRWEGSDRHFGFLFDIGKDTQAGFFFEEASWDWKGDIGQAVPNFVNTTAHLSGIRILRKLHRFVSAGLDIGTAQIAVQSAGGTTAGVGAVATPLTQTKPFFDILARGHIIASQTSTVTSGLNFDVGYRFLDINDVAGLGPAGEASVDDLNSIILGAGVFLEF